MQVTWTEKDTQLLLDIISDLVVRLKALESRLHHLEQQVNGGQSGSNL